MYLTGYYYYYYSYIRPSGLFLWNVINLDGTGVASSVSTLRHTAGRPGFWIVMWEKGFFYSWNGRPAVGHTQPPRQWMPTLSFARGWGKIRGVTLRTHHPIVLGLKMTGAVSVLPHTPSSLGQEGIYFLNALAKFRKVTVNFVMLVCTAIRMEQLTSHCTDFYEIWYWKIFLNVWREN